MFTSMKDLTHSHVLPWMLSSAQSRICPILISESQALNLLPATQTCLSERAWRTFPPNALQRSPALWRENIVYQGHDVVPVPARTSVRPPHGTRPGIRNLSLRLPRYVTGQPAGKPRAKETSVDGLSRSERTNGSARRFRFNLWPCSAMFLSSRFMHRLGQEQAEGLGPPSRSRCAREPAACRL